MAKYDDYLVGGAALRRTLEKLKEREPTLASLQDVIDIVENYGHDEES